MPRLVWMGSFPSNAILNSKKMEVAWKGIIHILLYVRVQLRKYHVSETLPISWGMSKSEWTHWLGEEKSGKTGWIWGIFSRTTEISKKIMVGQPSFRVAWTHYHWCHHSPCCAVLCYTEKRWCWRSQKNQSILLAILQALMLPRIWHEPSFSKTATSRGWFIPRCQPHPKHPACGRKK